MPVEVRGADNLKRALRKYDPDLYKALNKQIGAALKTVTGEAKLSVEPNIFSGAMDTGAERVSRTSRDRAFPTYNSQVIRNGLTYSMAKKDIKGDGWKAAYSLLNKSAIGSIVEIAGTKNPHGDPRSQSNNPSGGAQFIQELNQEYGNVKKVGKGRGRLMYNALEKNQGKARDAIVKAVEDATRQFKAVTR